MQAVAFEKFSSSKQTNTAAARQLLLEPSTAALALVIAAKAVTGPEWNEWEPETLWLSLEAKGLDVPAANRAKIMAAWTLAHVPSFYWDGVVFEKTALAFNGHEPRPDILEEATSAQLAWAVQEAARICEYFEEAPRTFEHEPRAYAAVVLHREGFVVTPDLLNFAQAALDGLNCRDTPEGETCPSEPLKQQVEKAWATLDKTSIITHAFSESRLDVQLALLATVATHVKERETCTAEELRALHAA